MAITTVWSISDMDRKDSDGGVFLVRWSCVAHENVEIDGLGKTSYSGFVARETGKLRCEPDPSASGYIAYADLTENDVLGWVYNSIRKHYHEDDADGNETTVYTETAAEAKARTEEERTAKVQGQIDRATANSTGVPWAAE